MTPSEVILRARDRLIEKGWIQQDDGPESGPNCLRGALVQESNMHRLHRGMVFPSAQGEHLFSEAMTFVARAIGEYENRRGCINARHVTSWNDAPGRKESQVIGILDLAAVLAKDYEAQHARPSRMAVTA